MSNSQKTPDDSPPLPQTQALKKPMPEEGSESGDTPTAPEFGGRGGLDPTRYGDWEKNGRCVDF